MLTWHLLKELEACELFMKECSHFTMDRLLDSE